MKCLVTGGAGFIGSHLVDHLIELGHIVAILDNLRSGKKSNINPKAKFYEIDVRDSQGLDLSFGEFKPDIVFHLAAQNEVPYSMEHPYEDAETNITGMMRLLDACVKYDVKKVVYSNTGGAFYGEVPEEDLPIQEDHFSSPTSFYGASKQSGEIYLRLYGNLHKLPWVALRYSNVYGPRQDGNREAGIVAVFTHKLLHREQPTINGQGEHTRDYVFVGDVVAANLKAMDYPNNGYFNISTGKETSNLEVFNALEDEIKTDIRPQFGPNRPGDPLRNSLSPEKAKQELGWEPRVDFKEGVHKTVQYYIAKA